MFLDSGNIISDEIMAWRLEASERVYTPRGVERVTEWTGLPGVIICKALWASFGQEKRYIRTAYYYYYYYIRQFSELPGAGLEVLSEET